MWDIHFVKEQIALKQDLINDKDDFIREADFSRDLTEIVESRRRLVNQLVKLQVIELEMEKSATMSDMDLYIAQKASVYALIEEYKS